MKINTFGESMGLRFKLKKHMEAQDPYRVKDYLTEVFNDFDPIQHESHMCWSDIKEAIIWLTLRGWTAGSYDWGPENGIQFTCVSPNGEWFRSHYDHHQNKRTRQ